MEAMLGWGISMTMLLGSLALSSALLLIAPPKRLQS
jgi:hypothetical protein